MLLPFNTVFIRSPFYCLLRSSRINLFAVLVIDIVPALRCLNMAYALCLEVDYGEQNNC